MLLKVADVYDIDEVLKLHSKYQVDTINQEDKKDGFITTSFTKEQLEKLVIEEKGLFIARKDDKIVAYVMAASWQFWSVWPMFEHMIKQLNSVEFQCEKLTIDNSYQYGPVCVDKSVRGTDVLKTIFDFARKKMNERYPILVTFINKINGRSFNAHKNKLGLEVVNEFDFNNNNYYELCYDTSKPLVFETKK
ncbi:GNAT family acetyltransferase [Arcobacter sp. CECT 8985]|uniref:GNAT family acetyltransferase n=1 Tax=Arcobacter sp. CECT 8985 TaxID=1935424 RepID=UPI00100BEF4D|nr:GNAT family acetyltransferase [Arcobacter sp. CECT 8985]RXJ86497.1 GNAT family acetyltransferase [Arcobacter sp. CECT 8985]